MIKVIKIESEGGSCPYQVMARSADDRPVYARFRHGILRVEVGPPGAPKTTWQADTIFRARISEEYDGCLTYTELREQTKDCLDWPDLQ